MKASVFIVVALLALACVANAQPAKKNATATADDVPPPSPKAGGKVAAAKNATVAKAGAAKAAATGAGAGAAAEPAASPSSSPKADAKEAPAASPSPAPKKSGAVMATSGFAAAVAGSVLLMQLVL